MKKKHYLYKGTVPCGVDKNRAFVTIYDVEVTCKKCRVQMAIWDEMDRKRQEALKGMGM